MRIVAIALVLACFGCKDKQPDNKQTPARETQRAPKPPSLETPEINGPGLVPAVGLGPKVTFSKTEISLDDEVVVAIGADGLLDRNRLESLALQLEKKATSDAPIAIVLDATLTYRRVGQLLDVLKRAGFRRLALLTGSGSKMIPIELPDASEANRAGLRPVVSIQSSRLMLWSASGQEGTRTKPKLVLQVDATPDFQPLTRALAEIVQRRWSDGKRANEDRTIIIQLDGNQPAHLLLRVLAAVRADGSLELFPNIFLAGG